jgi:hypothetical protein
VNWVSSVQARVSRLKIEGMLHEQYPGSQVALLLAGGSTTGIVAVSCTPGRGGLVERGGGGDRAAEPARAHAVRCALSPCLPQPRPCLPPHPLPPAPHPPG